MSIVRIRKGHNLRLEGVPAKKVYRADGPGVVVLSPQEYKGVKPRLAVSEGDRVEIGSPVWFDKRRPELLCTSPAAGTVTSIVWGERRALQSVSIDVDSREQYRSFSSWKPGIDASRSTEMISSLLLESGLWPVIRQRPFSRIADPDVLPKAVFVPAMPTVPFAPDIHLQLEGREEEFRTGLMLLSRLTRRPVHLVISADNRSQVFSGVDGVELHRFSGPHPAGNVGIHIHHIAPIRHRDDVVWYVLPQDVARIGGLFLSGRLPVEKIIAVGGEAVEHRHHVAVRYGMRLSDILAKNTVHEPARLISGDVLSGTKRSADEALGFYDETVSVIPEHHGREFLGWLRPGRDRYTLTPLFLSFIVRSRRRRLDTAMNGSRRVMIPFGNIESVLPMDILPTWLIKMIIARDIDEMEKLGIYECDPEDFALCSFADASKMEISDIIREGLEYVEKNG